MRFFPLTLVVGLFLTPSCAQDSKGGPVKKNPEVL